MSWPARKRLKREREISLAEGKGFGPPHAPAARGDPGLDTSKPKAQRFSRPLTFVPSCPICYQTVPFFMWQNESVLRD